jgi:uncharacterized protein DUF3592
MASARRRTTRLWFRRGLAALVGLFLVFGAIFTGTRGWIVFASGGVATATVQDQTGDQRHREYQVTFTTRDGATRTEWMERPAGKNLRVGEQVKIRYDRAHPDDLYPASDLIGRTIVLPLIILGGGLFFLLFIPIVLGAAETSAVPDPIAVTPVRAPDARIPRTSNRSARRRRSHRRRRHTAKHPETPPPQQE